MGFVFAMAPQTQGTPTVGIGHFGGHRSISKKGHVFW